MSNGGNVRRKLLSAWKPTFIFLAFWLGAFPSLLRAQTSTDQVWSQLLSQSATAVNDGFKRLNYMIGYMNTGTTTNLNWPVDMEGGRSYLIVGVCDNDCTDVDLVLEDRDRAEVASDVLADDIPVIRFAPNKSASYWIRTSMVVCRVEPCGYGIAVFVR
jgi:hypothetical protein